MWESAEFGRGESVGGCESLEDASMGEVRVWEGCK